MKCRNSEMLLFLGSLITKEGNCMQEIKRRIMMGRTAMSKLKKKKIKDKNVTKKPKYELQKR